MTDEQIPLPKMPPHSGFLLLHNTGSVSQVWGYTEKQVQDLLREHEKNVRAALAGDGGELSPHLEPAGEYMARMAAEKKPALDKLRAMCGNEAVNLYMPIMQAIWLREYYNDAIQKLRLYA